MEDCYLDEEPLYQENHQMRRDDGSIIHKILTVRSLQEEEKLLLIIDITDANDIFFMYRIKMEEKDYTRIRNTQGLLVDFNQFPYTLISLLQETNKIDSKSYIAFDEKTKAFKISEESPIKENCNLYLQFSDGSTQEIQTKTMLYLSKMREEKLMLEKDAEELAVQFEKLEIRWNDANSEIKALSEQLARMQITHEDELTSKLSALIIEKEKERDELIMTMKREFQMELAHRDTAFQNSQRSNLNLKKKNIDLCIENDNLKMEKENILTNNESIVNENKKLLKELTILRTRFNEMKLIFDTVFSKKDDLEKQLETANAHEETLRRNYDMVTSRFIELQMSYNKTVKDMEELRKKFEKVSQDLRKAHSIIHDLQTSNIVQTARVSDQIDKLTSAKLDLEKERDHMKEILLFHEGVLNEYNEEIMSLKLENSNLHKTFSSLCKEMTMLKSECGGGNQKDENVKSSPETVEKFYYQKFVQESKSGDTDPQMGNNGEAETRAHVGANKTSSYHTRSATGEKNG